MGLTYVSLGLSRSILSVLDRLVVHLQKPTCSVSEMLGLVRSAMEFLKDMREDADDAIRHHMGKASGLSLEPIEIPRLRKPPARLTGPGEAFRPTSAVQWLRKEYCAFIDATLAELKTRFDQDGVHEHEKLERLLLGPADRAHLKSILDSIAHQPEELELDSLCTQLRVFMARSKVTCLRDAQTAFQGISQDARNLLPQVEELLRQLLVLPASSATAERSLSALRRLKTWMRTTMSQRRLNSVAVIHVHRTRARDVEANEVARDFVGLNASRRQIFGSF